MNAETIALWRTLPKNACLSINEIARCLGISTGAIHNRVSRGTFPKPKCNGEYGFNSLPNHKNKANQWLALDVVRWIDAPQNPVPSVKAMPSWRAIGSRVKPVQAPDKREAARLLANRIIRRKYGARAFASIEYGLVWMVEGWQTTRADPNTSVRVGPRFEIKVETMP